MVCHARLEEGRRGHLRQLENGMPFGGWSKHNFCDCFAAKRHEVRAWQVRFYDVHEDDSTKDGCVSMTSGHADACNHVYMQYKQREN